MALKMSAYRSISTSRRESVRRGRSRLGQDEYGLQVDAHEGPRPLGLEIEMYRVERRGNRLLARGTVHTDVPWHYVRVYEDGTEERI